MTKKRVLVTGASGLIGGILCHHLGQFPDRYEVHAMARSRVPRGRGAELKAHGLLAIPDERFHLADLSDYDGIRCAVEGMDVVVHLAAVATSRAGFDLIERANIAGFQNVMEAARLANVKRVVFASTIQVVFGYFLEEPLVAIREDRIADLPPDAPVLTANMPTRPTSDYSCSKVWGEGLCWMYSQMHGLSCLCVRIGSVPNDDCPTRIGRGHWCSHSDLSQMFQLCIDAPDDLKCDIFFASSDNRYRWVDIGHAGRVLGYAPQDDAEHHLKGA